MLSAVDRVAFLGVLWVFTIVQGCALVVPEVDAPASRGPVPKQTEPCTSPLDECDDGDPCTADSCEVGLGECLHAPIVGCCSVPSDCPAVSVCVETSCEDQRCVYTAILGCEPNGGLVDAGMDSASSDAATDGGGSTGTEAGPADASPGDAPATQDASTDAAPPDATLEDAGGGSPGDASATADGSAAPGLTQVRGGACSAGPAPGPGSPLWSWVIPLTMFALFWLRRSRGQPRGLLAWGLVGLSALAPAHARARGFRLDRLQAPSLPQDLFWLERAPALLPDGWGTFARVATSYASDPLVAHDGTREVAIVSEQLAIQVAAGMSAWRRLHLSIAFPFWLQRGEGASIQGGMRVVPGSPAPGDPRLDLRVSLLAEGAPVQLAVALGATLPVGDVAALAADHGTAVTPRLQLAIPVGPHGGFVGGNLGVAARPRGTLGDLEVGSEVRWAVGTEVGVSERVAASLEAAGSVALVGTSGRRGAPVELTAGMRYRTPWGLAAGLGVGAGVSQGYGTPRARALATLAYRWQPPNIH